MAKIDRNRQYRLTRLSGDRLYYGEKIFPSLGIDIALIIEVLKSEEFKRRVEKLGGFEVPEDIGEVIYKI